MKGNKILIINGHPDPKSFSAGLTQAYLKGAQASKAEVSLINIRDLKFDPNLKFGYRKRSELEPDLLLSIEKIKEAYCLDIPYVVVWLPGPDERIY